MVKNDAIANRLRERFAASGTLVVNVLSSPGSGKTTLLEARWNGLDLAIKCGVARRRSSHRERRDTSEPHGVAVRQITTGAECRLDADMIAGALDDWSTRRFDVLFIENVGNLICPAEYDLGEDLRIVLFSVTEGEDKPLKYPLAFNTSQVATVTKIDIAEAVGYDRAAAIASIRQVNPGARILELSARTGAGMDEWFSLLEEMIRTKSLAPAG